MRTQDFKYLRLKSFHIQRTKTPISWPHIQTKQPGKEQTFHQTYYQSIQLYEESRWSRIEKLNSKCKYPAVHVCSFSLDLSKICCVSRQRRTAPFCFLNFTMCIPHLNVITSLNHLLMSHSAPLTFVTQLLNKLSHCYSLLKEELCLFSCS